MCTHEYAWVRMSTHVITCVYIQIGLNDKVTCWPSPGDVKVGRRGGDAEGPGRGEAEIAAGSAELQGRIGAAACDVEAGTILLVL